MSSRSSSKTKPPRLPRHITFSAELSQALAAVSTPDETFNLTSTGSEQVDLQQARVAADAAELVALQRRLGTWKPSSSEFDEVQHSPEDVAGSSATVAAEASDPVAIGFELRPLATPGVTLRPGEVGEHHAAAGGETSSPTEGCRGRPESPICKAWPTSAKTQNPQRQTSASSWQRRPRNREGCSEEVRSRERRRLEEVVKSCGLLLEPDPQAPNREVLRAAPAPRPKRSSQEQGEATQRLCRGLSTRNQGTQRPQSACGGSAARFLRAQQQSLAGQPIPEVEPSTHKRPHSASSSRECGLRGTPSQTSTSVPSHNGDTPLHVHGLPVGETAAILQAALAGVVPVHLTQGPTSTSSTASAPNAQEGLSPPASLQAAVLTAALRGEIPVRSITTAGTKAWSADSAKALTPSTRAGSKDIPAGPKEFFLDRLLGRACIGGLYMDGQLPGGGAFAEPGRAREFELEEPDQELAPRCEAYARPGHSM